MHFHDASEELQMSIDHEEIETGGGRWRITPVITPLLVNVVSGIYSALNNRDEVNYHQ